MTREPNDRLPAGREMLPRPFGRAIVWMTAIWLVCFLLVLVALILLPDRPITIGASVAIAVASLLISYASLLPGIVDSLTLRSAGRVPHVAAGQRQSAMLVAGVVIRLIGTVALFLTCRYEMATPGEVVAGMTIGWYVLLTFVDTVVLARELPTLTAQRAQSGPSGVVETSTTFEA